MSSGDSHPITPLPKNIELIAEMGAITIRRNWRSPTAYFLLFFSLFWNGFMVVWMTIAFTQGEWGMAAFGSLHGAVGLGLAYLTLATFINKTDIRIDGYNLAVKHYPLAWPGQQEIPVVDIAQLYSKERITRNKNGTTVTYQVHVVTKDNRQKKLLSGLTSSEQARYIEREIEKTLGLKDTPVSGEMSK